jgi:hypothetical protein
MRKLLPPLVLGLALAAALPALAQADSIVFIKGEQVWTANPDGSGARQFTTRKNNWAWPSEADNGTVVVAGGKTRVNPDGTDSDGSTELYRFSRRGRQLSGFTPTYGSYSSPSCPATAPTSVRVSPDASKIAYGIFACNNITAMWTPAGSTRLNFPNQTLGQEDFFEPFWVDSSHFVVSHVGPTVTDTQARWFVHDVGAGDDVGPGWNEPSMMGTGAQAVISRDGTRFAVFEDDSSGFPDGKPRNVTLWLYTSDSLGAAESGGWTLRCKIGLPAGSTSKPLHLSPSFSPDGTQLLWGDDDGVEVASVANPGDCGSINRTLLIRGGSHPFFSSGSARRKATPHAAFKIGTSHPHAGQKVLFDGRKSSEKGGKVVSWSWRFGDGKKAKGRKVRHAYRRPGSYTVTLTVRDRSGAKAKVRHRITVAR